MTYLGKGHYGYETEREPQGSVPVEVVRNEAQWDKYEQDVHPRSKKELEGLDPSRLIVGHGKDLYESLPIREPVLMAVDAMTVLQEGCPVGWGHRGLFLAGEGVRGGSGRVERSAKP